MVTFTEEEARQFLAIPGSDKKQAGNAFFINSDIAITAWHVVGEVLAPTRGEVDDLEKKVGCNEQCGHLFNYFIRMELPHPSAHLAQDGKRYSITKIDSRARLDEDNRILGNDISILLTSRSNNDALHIEVSDSPLFIGMPLEIYTLHNGNLIVQEGKVTKLGEKYYENWVSTDIPATYGYSGSPVFSEGKLVAILIRGDETVPKFKDGRSPAIIQPILPISNRFHEIASGLYAPREFPAYCQRSEQ